MSENNKETLKALKAERKEYIERARKRVKEQNQLFKKITTAMTQGASTVPQIAESAAISTRDAFWSVIALKTYGKIDEGAKAGDYFTYKLAEGLETEEEPQSSD